MAMATASADDGDVMVDINTTPLIDVMLVLLVIFIIAAPLLVQSINLQLPKAQGEAPAQSPQVVQISIDRTGQVFDETQPINLAFLAVKLQAAARGNPDTEMQLRADTTVPYGRVMEVMSIAHKAGLHRIGFITDATAPSTP